MREGISLTLKSLLKVAENHGMAQVNPIGEPLDPERHHAVSMVDAPGHAPGTVVSVLQKGYVLNERLLRPALVAVANDRSEEHTSELQSLMRISYAVFCL